ncbi:MAG: hypothetical protein RR949_05965 [Oscillospiraceae bacterium]
MDYTKNEEGYLVDRATGKPVVFYTCDPFKNTACDKAMCRAAAGEENEATFGLCASTAEPEFREDGKKPFYKRLNDQGYFGREYIEEG